MKKNLPQNTSIRRPLLLLLIFLSMACAQIAPQTDVATVTQLAATSAPSPISVSTEQLAEASPVPQVTEETALPTPVAQPGELARSHVEYITTHIGARLADTQAEIETAQYIQTVLTKIGYTVELQPFSKVGWVGEDEIETRIRSNNVIATKRGESEAVIVIGAHYDSVDTALGADDNASGVGVLLELAAILYDLPSPYTLRFVAFGAEEVGTLGSYAYVEALSAEERQQTVAMINLDSISAGDTLYVYSREGKGALVRDWALAWAAENDIALETIRQVNLNDDDGYPTADHGAFQEADIPFAYFEATNWTLGDQDGYTQVDTQYGEDGAIIHTTYDRLDYFDATFPGRVEERLSAVTRIVQAILTDFKASE